MNKGFIWEGTLYPPMVHAPSLCELENGDLFAVWYAASYETSPDTLIMSARWNRKEKMWSKPKVIIDIPGIAVGNPVLGSHEGNIYLFYPMLFGESWKDAKIVMMVSAESDHSWGRGKIIFPRKGLMTKTKPLIFPDKRILLPVYDERIWCSMVLISDPPYKEWRLYGDLMAKGIAIQPAVVERDDGVLLMYSRTNKGKIWQSLSYDKGYSWIASYPTSLPNPNSGIDMIKLYDGRLALVMNDLEVGRYRLVLAFSHDNGRTWKTSEILEEGEGEFSYPSLIQTKDKRVHILYTWERVKIAHVII